MLLTILEFNIFIGLAFAGNFSSTAKMIIDNFNITENQVNETQLEINFSFDVDCLINYYDVDLSLDDYYIYSDTVNFTFSNIYNTTQNKIIIDYLGIAFNPSFLGVNDYDTFTWEMEIACELVYHDRLEEYSKTDYFMINEDVNIDMIQAHELTTLPNYINVTPSDIISYNQGYDDGKQDGITEGYQNGYTDGYEEGESEGYEKGYNQGIATGGGDSTANGIQAFLGGIFGAIDSFLSVEIIPGLSLWAICLIPIMFGVLSFFLNLWR